MATSKRNLIDLIIKTLNEEVEALKISAQAAHAAATHEESKSEDRHDTRGIEASYLAGAQTSRIQALLKVITYFQFLKVREFKPSDSVDLGACIELDLAGQTTYHFLASQGGGLAVQFEGKSIQVITPQAPLGDGLLGKVLGDTVEVEIRNGIREYEIKSIW